MKPADAMHPGEPLLILCEKIRVGRPSKESSSDDASDWKPGSTFTISMANDDTMMLEAESEKEAEEWAIKVALWFCRATTQ